MSLITPGLGLIVWMLISFSLVLFILGKYAWKPIMSALKNREDSIRNALKAADLAKEEMAKLKADNEKILDQARKERDAMISEARDIKDQIIAEAKQSAQVEADKIRKSNQEMLEKEKQMMMTELKNQVASFSIEIAEKILRARLSEDPAQQQMVNKLIDEIKLN